LRACLVPLFLLAHALAGLWVSVVCCTRWRRADTARGGDDPQALDVSSEVSRLGPAFLLMLSIWDFGFRRQLVDAGRVVRVSFAMLRESYVAV